MTAVEAADGGGRMELVDPRGTTGASGRVLAARRDSATGVARIGFLSNEEEHATGPHFPGYTRVLEAVFRDRLGVTDYHREVKPVLSRPAEPEQIARFAGCDVVVNGLAK
jgi:hypothetical protein